jgi:hypothetical protein
MGKARTCWDLTLTLGIPFSRWGAQPFIVHPIPFPIGILNDLATAAEDETLVHQPLMRPLLLAHSWRQQMNRDALLTKARIAAREGISRARVTQVMNLLRLPEAIQKELRCPPAPLQIHSFSERRLRSILVGGDEAAQARRWRLLVDELMTFAAK